MLLRGENMSETKLIVDEEFRSVDEETRKAGLFFGSGYR